MGFYGCIPRFIKNHASWILTALGLGGMVGTVILTAKAAPKVADEISEEVTQRWYNEATTGTNTEIIYCDNEQISYHPLPKLTFGEKFEIAASHYLPAFLTGLATAACFVGAQIINGKQQAALIAAYGLLAQEFGQYREAIKTEYGEEADRKAMLIAKQETAKLSAELEKMREENGPFLYTFASMPGIVFDMAPTHMQEVLYHFTRNMVLGRGSLDELYKLAGLPASVHSNLDWSQSDAAEYGWDTYENEVTYGDPVGYFNIIDIGRSHDGVPVKLIDFSIPPYQLDKDYGQTDSSLDFRYPAYNPDMAKEFAKGIFEDEVLHPEETELYVQSPW